MINRNHISQLINSPWAISNGALETFVMTFAAQANNHVKADMPMPFRMDVKGNIGTGGPKEILVIPIDSIIVKYDEPYSGLMGLKTLQNYVNQVYNDNTLIGAVMYHESPGGTVMDLAETADLIWNCPKPIVSFLEMSCSASYYLAAASKYIIASPMSAMIGNIGTRTSPMDIRGIWGKLGAKYADVFGTQAYEKDLGLAAALDGNPEKMQQMMLDPHNDMFVNDVLKFRPQINEAATHGAVYLSAEAVNMGLIDSVGVLQDAIDKVYELSSEQKKNSKINNNQNNKSMSNVFKTVIASLGFKLDAKTDNTEHTEDEYASALVAGIQGQLANFTEQITELKNNMPAAGLSDEQITEKLKGFVEAKAFDDLSAKLDSEIDAHKQTKQGLADLCSKVPGGKMTTPPADEDKSTSTEAWTPIV